MVRSTAISRAVSELRGLRTLVQVSIVVRCGTYLQTSVPPLPLKKVLVGSGWGRMWIYGPSAVLSSRQYMMRGPHFMLHSVLEVSG